MENLRRSPQPAARPTQSPEPAPVGPEPTPTPPRHSPLKSKSPKKSQNKLVYLVAALGAILLLALGGWFMWNQSSSALIDSGKYQAVFLTNGQVYFGKLEQADNDYYTLNKIFYLQATEQAGNNPQEASEQSEPSNDVQLIKLGTEVHGPEDEMVIGREQVLFYENLKDDGSVVKSINSYYEANKDN